MRSCGAPGRTRVAGLGEWVVVGIAVLLDVLTLWGITRLRR